MYFFLLRHDVYGSSLGLMQLNYWIFFSNSLCALALNLSAFIVIATGAVTIRVAATMLHEFMRDLAEPDNNVAELFRDSRKWLRNARITITCHQVGR
ncbi:hypothetical protein V6N12_061797 [Hibiscus sabdariffa]|uniref:Uncharacterized protein n=1 Tax=Hibiscus sabdariffa TaxID=183260 RepID=A0ABR2DY40_9ROSI